QMKRMIKGVACLCSVALLIGMLSVMAVVTPVAAAKTVDGNFLKAEYIIEGRDNVTINSNGSWTVKGDFALAPYLIFDYTKAQPLVQEFTTNVPLEITFLDSDPNGVYGDHWVGLYENWVGPQYFPAGSHDRTDNFSGIWNWCVQNCGWKNTGTAAVRAIYFEFDSYISNVNATIYALQLTGSYSYTSYAPEGGEGGTTTTTASSGCDLLAGSVQSTDTAGAAVSKQNGGVVINVKKAWNSSSDISYGAVFDPNFSYTIDDDAWIQLGINAAVPFRFTIYDGQNSCWISAGSEYYNVFELNYAPSNQWIPAGNYTVCLSLSSYYNWYMKYGGGMSYSPTAAVTSVFIEGKSTGTITLKRLKLVMGDDGSEYGNDGPQPTTTTTQATTPTQPSGQIYGSGNLIETADCGLLTFGGELGSYGYLTEGQNNLVITKQTPDESQGGFGGYMDFNWIYPLDEDRPVWFSMSIVSDVDFCLTLQDEQNDCWIGLGAWYYGVFRNESGKYPLSSAPKDGWIPAGSYTVVGCLTNFYKALQYYYDKLLDATELRVSTLYIEGKQKGNISIGWFELLQTSEASATPKYNGPSFTTIRQRAAGRTFPDVPKNAWYYDAVRYVTTFGYMNGYQSGKFGPGDKLQRQDFVVALANIYNADLNYFQNKTGSLKDVKKGSYYAPAVAWAVYNGIVAGYQNGKFGVGDPITREQVCTILWRAVGSPAPAVSASTTLAKYPDGKRVSDFAKNAVAWALQNGIITGMQDGRIAPVEKASRAQIAVILMRLDQKGMFE
ncbi:MAG: S-layer homology domain-containing protein, partial [Clostridia bacterium]|nr:S-layer homology domain-containing protein [Clostridia bacterium]